MRTIVTGAAGFIGSQLSLELLNQGHEVLGIDNHNDYYDKKLKEDRIARHTYHENYNHLRFDISDRTKIESAFKEFSPTQVIHLAAQAGVRYSLENPHLYIESNVLGFMNVLEASRQNEVKHLIYASSSSVYGANCNMPFSVHEGADHPLSIYAASKRSNELMAHTYSHLYGLPSTGLRFFTVYGPWGRPDMALFKFTKAILEGKKIQVFNHGDHQRDFTFIDDIIDGIIRVMQHPAEKNENWNSLFPDPGSSSAPWCLYNIGNNRPVELTCFIHALEKALNKKAVVEFLPAQAGDIQNTFADIVDLSSKFNYKPSTTVGEGIDIFVDWYRDYFQIN